MRIALLAVAAAAVLLVNVDFALAVVDVALPEQRNSVPYGVALLGQPKAPATQVQRSGAE